MLTHDEKFDIPALAAALRTEAFYVGALGSRRAQEKRRERLVEAGLTDARARTAARARGARHRRREPGRDRGLDPRRGARAARRPPGRPAARSARPHPRRALRLFASARPTLYASPASSLHRRGRNRMSVKVLSENVRDLVDEDAEVEQIATGFTFTEGPIWMPDGSLHFSDMPGDKRRRWHPDGRRHGAARPEQQVQRDDARQRRQPDRLRARDELGRPRAPRRDARDARHALGRQGAEQPERRDRRLGRLDHLHRPDLRPHARVRPRAAAGPGLPGRLPPARGRRRPAAADRRLRAAERALLHARRVAALHQRHRARAHPRLRRRPGPRALERPRLRRGHRHRRPRERASSSTG